MPQYLLKQIEVLIESHEVFCIEWDNVTGGIFIVQRRKIENLLKGNFYSLPSNKEELFSIIEKIKPDYIHFQEIPEFFIPDHIAEKLYSSDRKYIIIETSHDSSYNINNKIYFPDLFVMVSQYQINQYKKLGIPCKLLEYPIEKQKTTKEEKEQILNLLKLDPNKKHIICVGLFTPRKNQKEVVEYARALQYYPEIQFHFIGNQADNFKHYWEPIMQFFPINCKWWGERSDVEKFYKIADLMIFASKGTANDKETMPLVIREGISYNVPTFMYNLEVYLNYFDKYDNITYLSDNFNNNVNLILNKLNIPIKNEEFIFYNSENSTIDLRNFDYHNKLNMYEVYSEYGDIPSIFWTTYLHRELDKFEVAVEEGDIYVDLGAHIGITGRYALLKGAKEIHCFEPDINLRKVLKKNLPSAKIYELGVTADSKELETYHWPYNELFPGPKYTTKTVSIKKILELIPVIDYLKIDIEGFEKNLFNNLSSEDCKNIHKMMIEYHTYSDDETWHFVSVLKEKGFKCDIMFGDGQNYIYAKNTNFQKLKLNECIIISTYTKQQAVCDLTLECIKEAQQFNIPIILTSHYTIPENLQKEVDYSIMDKNNILVYHDWYKTAWLDYPTFRVDLNIDQENNHIYHGPAVYTNYYNGLHLAKSLGFKQAYCFNFDMLLKSDTSIKKGRESFIKGKKGLLDVYNAGEGKTIRTVWHAIDVDFFVSTFPKILNGDEYNKWVKNIKSESNGLENIYYHQLKDYLNEFEIIDDKEFYEMFKEDEIDISSQIEYFTILPILNNDKEFVIYYRSANEKDSKLLKIYINNSFYDSKFFNKKDYYLLKIAKNIPLEIKGELIDYKNDKILKEFFIKVDQEYLDNQLHKNGIYREK